jgi:hypothetical protein
MAIALSGSTQYASRSASSPNANSDYTLAAWVRPTIVNNWQGLFFLGPTTSSTESTDYCEINSSGQTYLRSRNGAGTATTATTGSALSANTWYHLALVRSGDTLTLHLNGVSDTSQTAAVAGRNATSALVLGGYVPDSEFLQGRIAAVKAWSAALSASDIAIEMQIVRPRRAGNLWGWWPMIDATLAHALIDIGGSARDLTGNNTPTIADGPPVRW